MSKEVEICLLMGLAPFVLNGLKSKANNILRIGLKNNLFRKYIGFTREEICRLLENEPELLHGDLKERLLHTIEFFYDGYFFGDDGTTYYCSYAVTNYLGKVCDESKYVEPIRAWLETDRISICFEKEYYDIKKQTIEALTNLLQKPHELKMSVGNFSTILPDKLTTCPNFDTVLAILYNYGYLTYDYAKGSFRIPNEEVKYGIIDFAKDLYGVKITGDIFAPLFLGKTAEFEASLRKVLEGLSFRDDVEAYYHGMLYALMHSELSSNYKLLSNREAAKGIYDILAVSYRPRPVEYELIVIEVKYTKAVYPNLEKLAGKAITQIQKNQYGKEDSRRKKVIWVGTAFSAKDVGFAYVMNAKYNP